MAESISAASSGTGRPAPGGAGRTSLRSNLGTMCGRFTLTVHHLSEVVERLGAVADPSLLDAYQPRYNIAPGDPHWLVRSEAGRRELLPAHWGLVPRWAKDPTVGYRMINARAESLADRPAYRDAFRKRRCVLPADGFYEWTGPQGDRRPIWFHAPNRSLLLLAGLYEHWQDPASSQVKTTFTIVTTAAAPPVSTIHDRMPALVAPEALDAWLGGTSPADLLRPAPPTALVAQAASRRVNSPTNDDPSLLLPDEDEDDRGQLSLL